MILSCIMLTGYLSCFVHPAMQIVSQVSSTSHRIDALSCYVDLSPPVLLQYHQIRYKDLMGLAEDEVPDDGIPDQELFFFDCMEEHACPPQDEMHFFDSFLSTCEMEGECNLFDFYDAPLAPLMAQPLLFFDDLVDLPHLIEWPGDEPNDDFPCLDSCPTPKAYNAAMLGHVDLMPRNSPAAFKIIFDSGASLAISPSKDDFVGEIKRFPQERRLGGMAQGMLIEGVGYVHWSFKSGNTNLVIKAKCYYVPDSKARLISPQRLFRKEAGITGKFTCEEDQASLSFNDLPPLMIDYDSRTHLPVCLAKNVSATQPQANIAVLDESNQNLTPSQKLLLEWHARFGHRGFATMQRLFRQAPFLPERFRSASRCTIPRCEVCEFAKAHRKPTKGNAQKVNPMTDGSLKNNHLRPGHAVSVDHFESRLLGRTYTSYGKNTASQYVGGCIFVDHMSGFVHVEHQLGFSGSETIRAKQNFEQKSLDYGVLIDSYLADNGVFKANKFVSEIRERNQKINYCGVNAHHKNAIAERSIRTISECARALLLHASLRWKSGIDSSLWPMAVHYAVYLYNHTPNSNGIAPADLYTGVQVERHKLKNIHTWGCPVYVLDPKLQQGKKLPRWEPRSRRGIFVGFSPNHSSDVPLVLNLKTGHISPQYHVVFDDTFSTVPSLADDEVPPTFWNELSLENDLYTDRIHRVHLEDDSPISLDADFMTPAELEEHNRAMARRVEIRQSSLPQGTAAPFDVPLPTTLEEPPAAPMSVPTPTSPPPPVPVSSPVKSSMRDIGSVTDSQGRRRSSRSNKGKPGVSFANEVQSGSWRSSGDVHHTSTEHIDAVFLSSVLNDGQSHQNSILSYQAALHIDLNTGESHCDDPRAYAASHKSNDPDNPSYHEALTGEHRQEYEAAMVKEIKQLVLQNTWNCVERSKVPKTKDGKRRPILKGTWAFKLKRLPDGSPLKFKARYCVRGDLQKEGVDYFETYAPVVQWSTVRLLLTMILSNNWTTKQVDYTNAFAQATLEEQVYIEPPKGFGFKTNVDRVLHLVKSLYGLKQAPKTFFEKLKRGLEQHGFVASTMDPCLFMKKNMMVVVYVDDTIIAGPDPDAIEALIKDLGVPDSEERETFALRDEGEVGDFLGIRIEKGSNASFKLSQTGLINKVLKASGMEDSNSSPTPASPTPLFIDKYGDSFEESWEYPEIVGMLMFLATNSRPDIAYAVNQCARFTHCPRASHATAVKRILRYLNGTKDKGMILTPTGTAKIDCYVDADFAGLWKVEEDQDPISVKSRSGHLIMFMGCPLQWSSKLQTQIALSTMRAEYIALSLAMRELIGFRQLLKEIYTHVLFEDYDSKTSYFTISKT